MIAVIIPSHNCAEFLGGAVRSAARGGSAVSEIVVVDDGSEDNTDEILAALKLEEPRLRTICFPENRGVQAARYAGLQLSESDYVAFLDADDWVEPGCYDSLAEVATRTESDITISGIWAVSTRENSPQTVRAEFEQEECYDDDLLGRFCRWQFRTGSLCNKLYRRELLLREDIWATGSSIPINEDYIINIHAFAEAKRVCVSPIMGYYAYAREGSVTRENDGATNFTNMMAAYAAAAGLYRSRGEEVLQQVDQLYRHQLQFTDYQVENSDVFAPHSERLALAAGDLVRLRPQLLHDWFNDGRGNQIQNTPQPVSLSQCLRMRLACIVPRWIKDLIKS